MNLLSFLKKQGFLPAVVSRGYKGRWEEKGGVLSDGKTFFGTWKDSGDEPFMMALNFPKAGVFVGRNRIFSCQKAMKMGFDIVLLDDGFQHLRLYRNLNIVLYDPEEKIALRESISTLKRADILMVKKEINAKKKKMIQKISPLSFLTEYSVANKGYVNLKSKKVLPPAAFKEKKIMLFCGIANPERFETMVKNSGAVVLSFLKFPDHFTYPSSSLRKIAHEYMKLQPEAVVMTEKDAVKMKISDEMIRDIPLYFLKIDLELENRFYEKILSCLKHLT